MASNKGTGDGKVVDLKKAGPAATSNDSAPGAPGASDTNNEMDGNTDQTGGINAADPSIDPPPIDPPPPTKNSKRKALRIRAKGDRFRRAGITFGREPTELQLSDLDKATIAELMAEPQLVIEEVEI